MMSANETVFEFLKGVGTVGDRSYVNPLFAKLHGVHVEQKTVVIDKKKLAFLVSLHGNSISQPYNLLTSSKGMSPAKALSIASSLSKSIPFLRKVLLISSSVG